MLLKEFRDKYPDYLNVSETVIETGVGRNKIKKLIELTTIRPLELNRVRLSYYLLSPKDVEIVRSFKNKSVLTEVL